MKTPTDTLSERDLFLAEIILGLTTIGGEPMKLPTTLGNFALVRRTAQNAWIFGTHRSGRITWEIPPLSSVKAILARLECEKNGTQYIPLIETEQLVLELEAA